MKLIKDIEGCLSEKQWRDIGIKQSRGWVNYCRYEGEPHILLFRRPKGTDPETGVSPSEILKKIEGFEKERIDHLNKVNPEINYEDFK